MTPALTVLQPHATAIVLGIKVDEYRTWSPPPGLVGKRLLIHAGKSTSKMRAMGWGGSLPLGAIVGFVTLVSANLEPGRPDRKDHPSCGDVRWLFSDPVLFEEPIPMPGKRGIFYPVLDL